MTAPKDKGGAAELLPEPPALDADDGAADTPPAKAKATAKKKSTGTGRPPGRPRNQPKLADRIEGMIGGIGIAVMTFDPYDGRCIIAGAPDLASALDQWAAESPAVKRTLEQFLGASAAGAVIIAVMKMAIPIAGHHGLLPAEMAAVGVGPLAGGVAEANGNNDNDNGAASPAG